MSYGFRPDPLPSAAMSSDHVARRGRRPGDLRVVVRRPAKLPRTLGAPSLFAACYGNVGSSIYYALGVTAAFPHAGGSSSFARRAFNGPIGFLVGWVQLLNYTATVSISAYFAISYLGVFSIFHALKTNELWHVGATVELIAFLMVVNVIGIQELSALNLVL